MEHLIGNHGHPIVYFPIKLHQQAFVIQQRKGISGHIPIHIRKISNPRIVAAAGIQLALVETNFFVIEGYNVLFKNAATLSTELCEAKDNYHLGKLERTLAKADLLILDELSYLSFNRHQSELLFKVISDRSEKSSTIVTTNLPFSKWTELFENTTMVAALIDRLTFRSHVMDMNGDSYRLKATMQSKK